MKRFLVFVLLCSVFMIAEATQHTISTGSNFFSPASITVQLGDTVIINASPTHPTTQVSQTTWNANGTTPLPGGWGTETAPFMVIVSSLNTIYFVCENHIAEGMKGQITVMAPSSAEAATNRIGLELTPNPVHNTLYYATDPNRFMFSELEVRTIDGKLVLSRELLTPSGEIEADLPTGQYIYVIRNRAGDLLAAGRFQAVQ